MIQTIHNWFYVAGKAIGADKFFRLIGPYGTLALTILIGLIYVICAFTLLLKFSSNVEINYGVRAVLNLPLYSIAIFIGYLYVTGMMGVIARLGGL